MKSNTNKKLMKSALLVISLAGSLPCQAAQFGNFQSSNFSQMSSVNSTSFTPVAPVAPIAPVRSTVPVSASPVTSVFTPTAGVGSVMTSVPVTSLPVTSVISNPVISNPVISNPGAVMTPINVVNSPVVGNFNSTAINQIITTTGGFNSAVNQSAGAGLNVAVPVNVIGNFGNNIGNLTGGLKGAVGGFNFADNGSNSPFHNVSLTPVVDGAKGGSDHSVLAPVLDGAGSVVESVSDHATHLGQGGGLGPVHAVEGAVDKAAKHTTHVLAHTINSANKKHRPQDGAVNQPQIPGLPNNFALTGALGSSVVIGVQQQSALTLFSAANQFLQGARGQILAGEPGTILSREQDVIILHKGRLALSSGEESTVVKTSKGDVKVNPSTVAIIDAQSDKSVHIIALYGVGDAVSLSGAATRGAAVSAKPGQELVVTDNNEEMIPVDGSRDVVVAGGVEIRASVKKNDISVTEMVEQYKHRAGRFAQLAGAANPADTTASFAKKKNNDDIWNLLAEKSTSAPMQIVAQPGAQIQQDEHGNVKLLYGSLFLAAKTDSVVHTSFATVNLKRNGLAMMETDGSVCRIKSMSGPGDLHVTSGDSINELAPGEELLIADHATADVEIIPADAIARRTRSQDKVVGNQHRVLNDFSMCSMFHYPAYRKMIAESDPSGKLAEKILKTAVVVEMVTRGHGKYAYSSLYQQQQQQVADNKSQKLSSR